MTQSPPTESPKLSWRFPATFWFANVAELFERAAYYAMFISITVYLTRMVGFNDVETGWIVAGFSFALYLLPAFVGPLADKMGFRLSLLLAFALLACGYALLGAFQHKLTAVLSLALVAFGAGIVKPVISGTAAKCSDAAHRARAFSIFYLMVNVGAFTGKTFAAPLRTGFTLPGGHRLELGLQYINFYAACMAGLAFILVLLAYRNPDQVGTGKSFDEVVRGFVKVLCNGRFMALILIVAGFWIIQGQLYASMPKYLLRLRGEGAKPEWLANINPMVVVLCVVPITHFVRHFKPANSIGIALLIIPLSALAPALGPVAERWLGSNIRVAGLEMHPITLMIIIGIAFQGLAECFLSPKFMEFASQQVPRGEEGLAMGFHNLPTSISWLFGFIASGYLLDAFCPDPASLPPAAQAQWHAAMAGAGPLPDAYAHAHYLWYFFVAVGIAALLGLILFKRITDARDAAAPLERSR